MQAIQIQNLEIAVLECYRTHGYAEQTIMLKMQIVRKIVGFHKKQKATEWIPKIANDYLKAEERRVCQKKLSRSKFAVKCRTVADLTEIAQSGSLTSTKRAIRGESLCEYFENLLEFLKNSEDFDAKFRLRIRDTARPYFKWLEKEGVDNLVKVDESVIRDYLVDCAARMTGGSLDHTRIVLKQLHLHFYEFGLTDQSFIKVFSFSVPKERLIRHPFLQDEIAAVLNAIDRSVAVGKRDYAIILLGAVTGLRSTDIVHLTLDSIDWNNGEIKIVQEKTGHSLSLPLTIDVGTAICEYLLHARPKSSSNLVFLRSVAPFFGLHHEVPNARLQKYLKAANVKIHRAFHDLRRSIATNMVTSGIPVTTVAQILGHATIDSTKQYISLDAIHLKECDLELSEIGGCVA
jgi:site-specific recombinase XerD